MGYYNQYFVVVYSPMGVCMTGFCIDKMSATVRALGSADFYSEFVRFLRTIIAFENVIVLVFSGESRPKVILKEAFGADVFALVESQYLSASYLLDPVYQFHLQGSPAGIYWLAEMAPDSFLRSRYYQWYYGRIGIGDEITIFLPVNETTTITISMGMDRESGNRFTAPEERNLKALQPVLFAFVEKDWQSRNQQSAETRRGPGSLAGSLRELVAARHDISLSNRQAEVALLILQGHSSPSIADKLGVSPHTVKVFRRQLYAKCGIKSQSELFWLMLPILKEISAFSN